MKRVILVPKKKKETRSTVTSGRPVVHQNKVAEALDKQLVSYRKKGDWGGSLARSPIKTLVDDFLSKNWDCKKISRHIRTKYGVNVGTNVLRAYRRNYFIKEKKGVQSTINDELIRKEFSMVEDPISGKHIPLNVKETLKIMELVKGRIFILHQEIEDSGKNLEIDVAGLDLKDQKIIDDLVARVVTILNSSLKKRIDVEKLINSYVHTLTQLQEYVAKYEIENAEKTIRSNIAQAVSELALSVFIPELAKLYPEKRTKEILSEYSQKIENYLKGQ